MEGLFPLGTGISRVRGIIGIVKQHKGRIGMSKLAEESEEDVDDLLTLLEASKLLGLIAITRSDVKLTPRGEKLITGATRAIIRESLSKIEPFKSTIKALSGGSKTTPELLEYLRSKDVYPEEGEHSSETLLKLLLAWGVRSKLLSYDEENETWVLIA